MTRSPAAVRRVFFVHYVRPSGQVRTAEVCALSPDDAVRIARRQLSDTAVWAGL